MRHLRHKLISLAFVLLLCSGLYFVLQGGQSSAQEADPVPQWGLFERQFDVPGEYENPYDPADMQVTARFTPPGGEVIAVPAFYQIPHEQRCDADGDNCRVQAADEGIWTLRFSPSLAGRWRYSIEATDGISINTIETGEFDVQPTADAQGFIRVGANGQYFAFQNGESYFPIGENLAWGWEGGGGLEGYLEWLDALAAAGGNYARIIADVEWFIGLDLRDSPGDYADDQAAAWMLDEIIAAAAERGIYLHIAMIWQQNFGDPPGLPLRLPESPPRPNTRQGFASHPYSRANGGPLLQGADVLSNPQTVELLQRKLRYMVARWGYSPQIFAWEIMTNVDQLPGFSMAEEGPALLALANYVRNLDNGQHLITVGSRSFLPELANAPGLDFVPLSVYGSLPLDENPADQVALIVEVLRQARAQTPKPLLITEFSLNPWFEPSAQDPEGIHIRESIWAAAAGGAAGGAMPWWWDTYIALEDLYAAFTPLARFAAEVEWSSSAFQPVQPGLRALDDPSFSPITLDGFNRSFRYSSPANTLFRLSTEGTIPPISQLSSFLYSSSFSPAGSLPQSYIITNPVDTQLSLRIRDVSREGGAQLVVTLDNVTYLSLALTAESANTELTIPIPAGQHVLVLDNLGENWIELESIGIRDYIAPMQGLALADARSGSSLIWLRNRDYTWQRLSSGASLDILNYELSLFTMPPGTYRLSFWDPQTGNMLGEDRVSVGAEGRLTVPLLPTRRDLAIYALRIEGDEAAPALLPDGATRTPVVSSTPSPTQTTSPSPTGTFTVTATSTDTATPTLTATATVTASPSPTATDTATPSPSPTETASATASRTPTPLPSATATRTPSPSASSSPSPTASPSATDTAPAPTRDPFQRATRTPRPDATSIPSQELVGPSATPTTGPAPQTRPPEGLPPRYTRTPRP